VVPIIPDEARTFGMDGLFGEVKIYAPFGQRYTSVDAGMVLSYTEASDGQILEEGITEAGAMASMTAAGTAYATHQTPMVPFYIFYSMFGYQRVGDLVWAFGDARGRGFMLGATAGRTTLNGEGLQHEDGHSPLLFSVVPNVTFYDPAYAYELAVIIRDGLRRMYVDGEDTFYYITLYNENYPMPPMPSIDGVDVERAILRGLYPIATAPHDLKHSAEILASGPAVLAALEAQRLLGLHHEVAARVWSATSYLQLRNEALDVERHNRLHPGGPQRTPYVTEQLASARGPVVAVSDYVKSVPEMISRFVPQPFVALGTDGYGRSDTRAALRRHFEVDAAHIVVATLSALQHQGCVDAEAVESAITTYGIDAESTEPRNR
jgi:pyruvate dehydrogenase E1 component